MCPLENDISRVGHPSLTVTNRVEDRETREERERERSACTYLIFVFVFCFLFLCVHTGIAFFFFRLFFPLRMNGFIKVIQRVFFHCALVFCSCAWLLLCCPFFLLSVLFWKINSLMNSLIQRGLPCVAMVPEVAGSGGSEAETWSQARPTRLLQPRARAAARRLPRVQSPLRWSELVTVPHI